MNPPAGEVNLRAENLHKRFGDQVAVDGLSLAVHEGEIFGLLGPNGAGKTTSISMMCGLLKPDGGQTFVYGKPTSGDDPAVRARVGVCPQNVVLWPRLTCLEQLEFMGEAYGVPRAVARRRAQVLLDEMGLGEKGDQLARTLSGGMQRRLSIILALVHEPDIVVLDEPEAGLDPQSRVRVREYIVRLAREKKRTVVFTTHNMDEAERMVDRVAIVDHGKLIELDTPQGLKRRVGKGDTLELGLQDSGRPLSEEAQGRARAAFPEANLEGERLTLRRRAIVNELPAILERVKGLGLTLTRVHLRESSLEDVFISLTGRTLRE